MLSVDAVVDANINRVAEGLRVIEEYVRFIRPCPQLAQTLAQIRRKINLSETHHAAHLAIRNTDLDARSKELNPKRSDLNILLKANFKRVEEGLRVLEEYTGMAIYNRIRYEMYSLEKTILLPLLRPQIKPGIYLISDQCEVLEQGLKWGVSLIQLRGKSLSKLQLLKMAKRLAPQAKSAGIPFIVNDFLDIALAVDADGFHSGQDDLDIHTQRHILGAHKLIGKTTHSVKQGLLAQKQGADYVSVGPLWDTPSKPGRKGIGFNYLQLASDHLSIPYVAIGGIDLSRFSEVLAYRPPLIGLIRDFANIPKMMQLMVDL
jgi:thiamine-phosphate pyrophosphorylase